MNIMLSPSTGLYLSWLNLKLIVVSLIVAMVFNCVGYSQEHKVVDGDTIKIEGVNYRLARIDCFESYKNTHIYRQYYMFDIQGNKQTLDELVSKGKTAKKLLQELTKDGFDYKVNGAGCYGHGLIELYDNDGNSINDKMIASDYCWVYGK